MKSLKKLRGKISKIDLQMRKLFIKRMNYSRDMKVIKDSLSLPYEDKDREEYLKRKYAKDLIDFRKEYLEFLDFIFKASKDEMKK